MINLISFFSILTILGHLFLFFTLFLFLSKNFFKFIRKKLSFIEFFSKYLSKYNLLFAFLVSLFAVLGSLSFSEILKLEPCKLCWYQRIFFYPLVIFLGLPLFFKKLRNDFKILKKYILIMALIGSLFSAYHYIIQVYGSFFKMNFVCDINGVSCSIAYFQFGYVTIPLMALTGFLMIIVFLTLYSKKD
ncbi:MAG: disulfide bond formation protein B [Candidatus Woesearchaeota archaeon]